MLKEYRLTIFAIAIFAVMIAFGISSAAKQRAKTEERIEIPLPLKDTSEQILYRNGYTVSYNKNNKIPNWVAWHLTAEHTTGPYRRPGSAWHEDLQVPVPCYFLLSSSINGNSPRYLSKSLWNRRS